MGKSLKAFEPWGDVGIAVLLREESSGCVCRTVQKKEREEGPKLGQWQWEAGGGGVGGGVM